MKPITFCELEQAMIFKLNILNHYYLARPPRTSVAYRDVGKGREQERKLTPLRGVQDDSMDGGGRECLEHILEVE